MTDKVELKTAKLSKIIISKCEVLFDTMYDDRENDDAGGETELIFIEDGVKYKIEICCYWESAFYYEYKCTEIDFHNENFIDYIQSGTKDY